MKAWSAPEVARLPGSGSRPSAYDSSSRQLVTAGGPASASLYVCGITPYDATHLGHAATYLAFDLLNRAWRDAGVEVSYVQNVTDVDDPLLERATATGVEWSDLAHREIDVFKADAEALRLLPPDHYVGVVESIDLIAHAVERLRAAGAVYEIEGDLYFSVDAAPGFGSVANLAREEMLRLFAERGGDPERAGKKNPLDCLLWRAPRAGEPSWETAIGPGRPGWHTECCAIALANLPGGTLAAGSGGAAGSAASIDVQGGGSDLLFPHHEMCAAQAAVVTARPFAGAYVHAGMVGFEGEKMSKSRGNLVFVSKLRADGADPMAIRLALLAHHYRDDWEWTPQQLGVADDRLARWRAAARLATGPSADGLLASVRQAIAADLDAPRALAAVDDWVGAANGDAGAGTADATAPALVRAAVDALLGIEL
jgi:L-cysteine:1D-myo-inositol 2-amino-2-deoxy-alpha-D-glucopyranoside ligase